MIIFISFLIMTLLLNVLQLLSYLHNDDQIWNPLIIPQLSRPHL